MSTTAVETNSSTASPAKLQSNVIGLLGAATLGVVFLSPAMTLYGLFGPIFLAAGSAAPLAANKLRVSAQAAQAAVKVLS